jgi:hypothetical protein
VSCHQGISPFTVPHTSIETHQECRALEDVAQATSMTIANSRATGTGLCPCPAKYYGLLQMLCTNIKLLMLLFDSVCSHMVQGTTIFLLMKDWMAMCERMMRNQEVTNILWAIFVDTRYFSTPHDQMGNPPVSTLGWTVGGLIGRWIAAKHVCIQSKQDMCPQRRCLVLVQP